MAVYGCIWLFIAVYGCSLLPWLPWLLMSFMPVGGCNGCSWLLWLSWLLMVVHARSWLQWMFVAVTVVLVVHGYSWLFMVAMVVHCRHGCHGWSWPSHTSWPSRNFQLFLALRCACGYPLIYFPAWNHIPSYGLGPSAIAGLGPIDLRTVWDHRLSQG